MERRQTTIHVSGSLFDSRRSEEEERKKKVFIESRIEKRKDEELKS